MDIKLKIIVMLLIGVGVMGLSLMLGNVRSDRDRLAEANARLISSNAELKASNEQMEKDLEKKETINTQLRDDRDNLQRGFQSLLDTLPDSPKLTLTPTTVVKPKAPPPVPDQPVEIDVAWKAYCKAIPGGCAPAESP